jgi:hypothetical protein
VTDEVLKLTDLYVVTADGRCQCFDVVVGLALSNGSGSCAGGSVAVGRAFNASQVTGDNNNNNNNNNIYVTAIGSSPGGSGFCHVHTRRLEMCI